MYAADFDDNLPRASKWMDLLKPYFRQATDGSAEVPATRDPRFDLGDIPKPPVYTSPPQFRSPPLRDENEFGYAFRGRLSGRKLAMVVDAERVALIFDSTDTNWNANGGLDLLPDLGRYSASHGGGINSIAFADGHATSLPPSDPRIK